MSKNGWRKCKYFGSMISFSSFFFLKEPLNNFSESFAVLFQQWTDAFPPCFVLLPHLLELSVFRPDDLLENRQCGEIGVSAQLSWPTDAAIAWQDISILEISNTHACTRSHMCTYMHPRSCLRSHTHHTQNRKRDMGQTKCCSGIADVVGFVCNKNISRCSKLHSRWYVRCQIQ